MERAGGHFNPDMKQHGLENPQGPHAGDMKNFTVKPDGTAKLTVTDDRADMGDEARGVRRRGRRLLEPVVDVVDVDVGVAREWIVLVHHGGVDGAQQHVTLATVRGDERKPVGRRHVE